MFGMLSASFLVEVVGCLMVKAAGSSKIFLSIGEVWLYRVCSRCGSGFAGGVWQGLSASLVAFVFSRGVWLICSGSDISGCALALIRLVCFVAPSVDGFSVGIVLMCRRSCSGVRSEVGARFVYGGIGSCV